MNMTRKGKKNKENVCEELRISVTLVLKQFLKSEDKKEVSFPSSFSSGQRAYVHRYCAKLGLKSKSRGTGANRYLTVYKKEGSTIVQADAKFSLGKTSQQHVISLLQRFPLSARERQELMPPAERDRMAIHELREGCRTAWRPNAGLPQVPPYKPLDAEVPQFRQNLPIWASREEIIQAVLVHQVVLICAETGSGKSTQVPQYILDYSAATGQPCQMICTQPRRIAAVSVADRVAMERGEKLGQTIGYQIRLENRVSQKTMLTYCTNGILLRQLMSGDSFTSTITHIFVDELHERDKHSDFLLIILRDSLLKFRNLKLVLMSAALDTQLFLKYFGGCPVVEVPGRLYEVRALFLENILRCTGYSNKAMRRYRANLGKVKTQQKYLESWCSTVTGNAASGFNNSGDERTEWQVQDFQDEGFGFSQLDIVEKSDVDPITALKMDRAIHDAWMEGTNESFITLLRILLTENMPVNYQHSETGVTPLMVASGRGHLNTIEQLLDLGASLHIRSSNDWTAIEFAKNFNQKEAEELLKAHCPDSQPGNSNNNEGSIDHWSEDSTAEICEEDKLLLDAYQYGADDERVDSDLIVSLVKYICYHQPDGSILVFLPGYDDIVSLREKFTNEERNFFEFSRIALFTLHSQMQNSDQRRVFKPVPQGVRKLILSTNIAETSITVEDVVYVIDSGKVKEKTYDALLGTSQLRTGWVSKASAIQRRGRAGRCRPGICYHLFSRARFASFQKYQVPEILRVPIHELCLQAKLLAPPNMPIADFLARAPDPPPFMVTRNAVILLKNIDALDQWEELTELGLHLLDLPVEPQLGKMVLFAVVLKCLDPVLTVACTLSYRDPFMLPCQPTEKKAALMAKKKFACGTFSDHLALLRAFQGWQKAKLDGYEHNFCAKNYISSATMEIISGMRNQLLAQLRASGFVRSRGGTSDLRDLNTNSDAWPVVRAAICAGSYPNLIRIDRERQSQMITQRENKVRFLASSVLNRFPVSGLETVKSVHNEVLTNLPSDWLIYEELSRVGRMCQAHCCTLVSPITVALFCGPAKLPLESMHESVNGVMRGRPEESDSEDDSETDSQRVTLKLDDWVSFRVDSELGRLAIRLRQKLYALVLRRMHMPSKPWSQVDEAVVRCIVAVLISEEQVLGLPQPGSIALRAHYANTNNYFQSPVYRNPHVASHHSDLFNSNQHSSHYQQHHPHHQQQQQQQSLQQQQQQHHHHIQESAAAVSRPSLPSSSCDKLDNSGRSYGAVRRPFIEKSRVPSQVFYSQAEAPECPTAVQSFGTFNARSLDASPPCLSPRAVRNDHRRMIPPVIDHFQPDRTPSIRYFIVKAQHSKHLEVALMTNTWAFAPMTERRLLAAIKEGNEVILIFSLQGSGHFQGFARFTGRKAEERPTDAFSLRQIGHFYYIEWLKKGNISFQSTRHLLNAWNENRKVQISRDGQELETTVGEELCKLWETRPMMYQQSSEAQHIPAPIGTPASAGPSFINCEMERGAAAAAPSISRDMERTVVAGMSGIGRDMERTAVGLPGIGRGMESCIGRDMDRVTTTSCISRDMERAVAVAASSPCLSRDMESAVATFWSTNRDAEKDIPLSQSRLQSAWLSHKQLEPYSYISCPSRPSVPDF